ncbi:hypothetical protein PVAP13_7NG208217 [Panicum virgatum]|uniref:Uncharacterized protein n=1 Tax=Panicum virgatum TaxID=38727 RepID=A0A8T0Q0S2_PANVG|nr:hypothetical protein PVAP13_7NG208217 [Panicum virgatum]
MEYPRRTLLHTPFSGHPSGSSQPVDGGARPFERTGEGLSMWLLAHTHSLSCSKGKLSAAG